jgi:hypothetical protein
MTRTSTKKLKKIIFFLKVPETHKKLFFLEEQMYGETYLRLLRALEAFNLGGCFLKVEVF